MREPSGEKSFFASLIPRYVSNGAVLFVYDLLAGRGRFFPDTAQILQIPGREPASSLAYMEDQHRRGSEPFGRSTVAAAGCEIIALYNALLYLFGREVLPFSRLVELFEKRGMALGGRWGTSPRALERFLRDPVFSGLFSVTSGTGPQAFESQGADADCAIVSYYNDVRDIRRGVHTICLTKEKQGFMAHNETEDGRVRGPYTGVSDFLRRASGGRAGGLYAVFIRKGQREPD